MLILADAHFGKIHDTILKEGKPSRLVDTSRRFVEVILEAAKLHVPLIFAGDLFDSTHPLPSIIDEVMALLLLAKEQGVKVFILPGNHDCGVERYSMPYLVDLLDNVKIVTRPYMWTYGKRKILMVPHMIRVELNKIGDPFKYAKKVYKDQTPDILITHAHLKGAVNSSDIEIEAGNAMELNPAIFPLALIITGHIHRYQKLWNGRAVYPGDMVTCSFDEAENVKGYIQASMSDLSYKFREFIAPETQYKHITVNLVDKDTIDLDPVKIEALVKDKLLKVSVYAKDAMQVHEWELRKAFNEFGTVVRFETIICRSMGEVSTDDVERVFEKIDFVPVLKNWINTKDLSIIEKKRAFKLGKEVIEEVLDAERVKG